MSLLDRWRNLSSAQLRPLQASLELTHRCNERCTHCYLEKFEDEAERLLTLDQWFHVLNELRRAGSLYLILMGGEAMLSPHFWPILERGRQLGFHVSMITNGLKINSPDVAKKLADSGMKTITLSLYSLNPAIHDKMTSVPGSHKKAIQALHYSLQAGLQVGINCLLTQENVEGYFDLADFCIRLGLEIKADVMVTPKFNGDLSPTHLRLTPEQSKWYYETLSKKWPAGRPKPSGEKGEDHVCNVARGKCAVTPYGELLTCIEVRESLGLLTEKPFEELWFGEKAEKWRSLKVQDLEGRPEGFSGNFCDHCPGMAVHENKNRLKVSDYAKVQAQIRREVYEQEL